MHRERSWDTHVTNGVVYKQCRVSNDRVLQRDERAQGQRWGTWYVRYETRSHGNKSQSDDEKRIDIPLEVTGEPETWMGGEQNGNVDMKGKGEGGRGKVEEKRGRGREREKKSTGPSGSIRE